MPNSFRVGDGPLPPDEEEHVLSCPDCGGPLSNQEATAASSLRCRIGHAFSLESLDAANQDELESSLWTALRLIHERVDVHRRLSDRMGTMSVAGRVRARVDEYDRVGQVLAALIEDITMRTSAR